MNPNHAESTPTLLLGELGDWHPGVERADEGPPASRWQNRAACRGLDPVMFFPRRGESTAEARAVCARCVVQAACFDHALNGPERFGIWGGSSERQRRLVRRQRRVAAETMEVA